jgi:hypothetical protein
MIIIGFSDIHGRLPGKDRLADITENADLVLLAGDITHFGGKAEARAVLAPFLEQSVRVRAVSGNCDHPDVDAYLNQQRVNLHGRGEMIDGIGWMGLGGSLITPFKTPNELSEAEIRLVLKRGINDIEQGTPLVLVSHQPPFQTSCDCLFSGAHVGSFAVREFIETCQPLVCFTGHIHESSGMDKIGRTHIINPGQLGRGGYAYAEIRDGNVSVEIRRWIKG